MRGQRPVGGRLAWSVVHERRGQVLWDVDQGTLHAPHGTCRSGHSPGPAVVSCGKRSRFGFMLRNGATKDSQMFTLVFTLGVH